MFLKNDDDRIAGELRALLMGLSLGGLPKTAGENADIDSEVGMLMSEFDSNQDGSVSREEFRSSLERCAAVNADLSSAAALRLMPSCCTPACGLGGGPPGFVAAPRWQPRS
jgi:hypothetical protein